VPKLFDVLETRDLVIEVATDYVGRRTARFPAGFHPVIKHLPGVVEFE
jgi:hypothetical protein